MNEQKHSRLYDLLPLLFCGLSVPLSIFMWLGNLAYLKLTTDDAEKEVIPPTRWLFSTFAPIALMIYALRRKGVDKSGAVLGLCIAIILSLASHAFFISLVVFFFTSSKATKFRGHLKRKIEKDYKEGGQRNWVQVLCNGGMATQLAILYLIDCGSGERSINFSENYRSSWLGIAVLRRSDSTLQVSLSSNTVDPTMNSEEAETEILSTQMLSSLSKSKDASGSISDYIVNDEDQFTDIVVDYDDLHEDALEYVAGYIAKRLKLGHDFVYPSGMSSQSMYTWIDEVSEGGLKKPTEQFLIKLKKLDNIFNSINKETINESANYLTNLLNTTKH